MKKFISWEKNSNPDEVVRAVLEEEIKNLIDINFGLTETKIKKK